MTERQNNSKKFLQFSTLGIEMGLSLGVGLGLGLMLDRYFGTAPWLLIFGSLFGIATAFRNLFRRLMLLKKEMENNDSSAE